MSRPETCPACAGRLDMQYVEYSVLPDPQYNPRTHFLLCTNQECAWWTPCTRRGEVVGVISENEAIQRAMKAENQPDVTCDNDYCTCPGCPERGEWETQ